MFKKDIVDDNYVFNLTKIYFIKLKMIIIIEKIF